MLGGPLSTQLGLHIIIKPLWSTATVININELWAVLQVYQCCTPLIHQTDSSANPSLARLLFIWAHQSTSPPAPAISPSSFPPPLKLTLPLAVTHSTVRLPEIAMSSKIPKIDLFIPAISFKNRLVKTLSGCCTCCLSCLPKPCRPFISEHHVLW